MKLKTLIDDLKAKHIKGSLDKEISKITDDSRTVENGDLFVCIRGTNFDGHNFMEDVIQKGAVAIVVEEFPEESYEDVTFIKVKDSREALARLAASYYGHPAKKLKLIGVTGTKGKTSISNMITEVIKSSGQKCGQISTLGIIIEDELTLTDNTTPDPLLIHEALKKMVDLGYEYAVIEVSSQSFMQKRVEGLNYEVGVFSNIAPDHISSWEHKDFEDYLNWKKEILKRSKIMVVNRDPELWKYLGAEKKKNWVTYSTKEEADYYSTETKFQSDGLIFGSHSKLKGKVNGDLELSLPGIFNVSNALAALAVTQELGIDSSVFFDSIKRVQTPGRTELIKEAVPKGRTVFVDYAHNKLSLENTLKSLREYSPNRLVVMFSFEYSETPLRRYDYGIAVGSLADYAILTSNSMGDYTFEELFADTIKGLDETGIDYEIVKDRTKALERVVDLTDENDIILLLGNGSDHYKIVDGVKTPFYEDQILINYLNQVSSSK